MINYEMISRVRQVNILCYFSFFHKAMQEIENNKSITISMILYHIIIHSYSIAFHISTSYHCIVDYTCRYVQVLCNVFLSYYRETIYICV